MVGGEAVEPSRRWNHNIHYHPAVLRALPDECERVLDVGCGEGALARDLTRVARHVTAIDRDEPTVELAERQAAAQNIDYVVGDFLTHDFAPTSFDALVSIAALHHMDTAPALERMRGLLRPGGALALVGLARSRYPMDLPFDAAGAIGTRMHRLRGPYREVSAPTVWPPPETYRETRRIASRVLPGVRYRRHIYWRYSLVWRKPGISA